MISKYFTHKKSQIVFLSDLAMTAFCLVLAILLRHDFSFSVFKQYQDKWPILFFSTLISYGAAYVYFSLFRGIWRFSSTKDLERIFKAIAFGTLINLTVIFLITRLENIPRSLFFIQPALLILGLGGMRFAYRILKDQIGFKTTSKTTVLIVGAGNGGIRLAKDLMHDVEMGYTVCGFIDDDPSKLKRTINGLPVLGTTNDLEKIVKSHYVGQIIIAIPSASQKNYHRILKEAIKTNIPVKTLPKLDDILLGKSRAMQLKEVDPEDFLGRDSIHLDMINITHMIATKTILVTGAGGSIGSELCRQIAQHKPKKLVLFELSEFLLYEIEIELKQKFPDLDIITIVGDVRDTACLKHTFSQYHPHMVLHAAAYKQVPLMERNPFQAINTNVRGTMNIANIANEFEVDRFVLISTDKAVNPTNVMGASKRIAEMAIEFEQEKTKKTVFTVVRFGNVLGSNGSVIPLFKKQIASGGPVTVTHPDITRYFMSIPEACQLVLQSASMSTLGQIFVLDMGEPVKILDLAKQMISMAGFVPEVDIEIKFTQLREGEKLYEELLADDETTEESHHKSIRIGKRRKNGNDFTQKLESLLMVTENSSHQDIHRQIKQLVPEFRSSILDIDQDLNFH